MLATLACGLTIDGFGPISDNAGGIAEMALFNPEAWRASGRAVVGVALLGSYGPFPPKKKQSSNVVDLGFSSKQHQEGHLKNRHPPQT